MPFARVRDLHLYYELHGDGEQLVLVNGALDTIASDWTQHLPVFARRYRVLAYDHRGHGRTDNPSARFTGYDQLAEDLVTLLDITDIGNAHLCGFSDGAITLIAFALRWPERVRSLILAGAQYTNDQRTLALLDRMTPERIEARHPEWAAHLAQLHDAYHEPGYWKMLLRQMRPFWRVQPDFALEQLARIEAPVLLVAGDRDDFGNLDQQVAMRRTIRAAELCVAPDTGHFVIRDQPGLFQLVTMAFLQRSAND
jgi:pimeloyl-ACP methyl ester carboxylesterase